jgi:SEC-C motif
MMRSEQEIFDDLAALCISKGYIHALATICFRDYVVGFKDELKPEDMARLYSKSRLIRTEVTTLIGLMMRAPIDFSLPSPQTISDYMERSEALLEELHQTLAGTFANHLTLENAANPNFNPFTIGEVLREAIFYGGESAYTFQYRDLTPLKYGADADWLRRNKGIDLEVGREVCRHVAALLNDRLMETLLGLKSRPLAEWTMLPAFAFSCDELAARAGQPVESIRAVVEVFAAPEGERNSTFTSLHDFNSAYAYPLIRKGPDEFLLLQPYGIAEALYETPFYWMRADEAYAQTALRHRGEFTETFAAARLKRVFGAHRVFQNVEILRLKGQLLGEIDVLVLFGNRAIVLQAKSKKLTLSARKGNDLQLQTDFKAAVHDAVDQAMSCAELLGDPSVTLRCRDGRTVPLAQRPRTVFPMSVVADHYPALAFQARQFLKVETTERIVVPLATDVFALDAITELLASPLRLLSYLNLRARFGDKFLTHHEHMLLSHHLKRNLWLDSDIDMMLLHDDILVHLDIAMAVRRDGVSGAATPDGILTRFEGTPFGRIIESIEYKPNPAAIDLGLMLLELSEDTIGDLNKCIDQVLALTAADGRLHDASIGISTASTGFTIHCSGLPNSEVEARLRDHCEKRKYLQRANSWFGLALGPDGLVRLVAELVGPWKFDAVREAVWGGAPAMRPMNAVVGKAGRNDPCPCGSGKKYRRCCIDR